jgi:hypothetical protein
MSSPPSEHQLRQSFTAKALARNVRLALGFGLFLTLSSLPMVLLAATDLRQNAFLALLMSFGGLFGVWLLAYAWRGRNVLSNPLMTRIREVPGTIQWAYIMDQQHATGGSIQKTVFIHAIEPESVYVLYSLHVNQVLEEVRAWCPEAHVGWTAELAATYEAKANVRNPGRSKRANRIAGIVFAALAALGTVGYVRAQRPTSVRVTDVPRSDGKLQVDGIAQPIDTTNKKLNALRLGNTELDMFLLQDADAGAVTVYFDPARVPVPTEGVHVRIVGSNVRQRGSGIARFVASSIESGL